MTLKETIEKLTGSKLTVNEALAFTNAQWGAVVAYVRSEDNARIKELEKIISVQQDTEKLFKEQNKQLLEVLEASKNLIGNSFAAIDAVNPTELKTVYNALWNVTCENAAQKEN